MAVPMMTSPPMTSGRRPMRSAMRPDTCSVAAVPTAPMARAAPATQARSSTAMASSGSTAIRTPKLVQPLANPEASTARYTGDRQASARLITSRVAWPSAGRRRAPPSPIATTAAAMSSATA